MSKYKVLVTDFAWPDLEIEREILSTIDAEIVLPESREEEHLSIAAVDCDAIMTCWAQTTKAVIAAATNCKIVARLGIGLDNIDVEFCTSNAIPVTNIPDYCVIEVAEHALASVFSLGRKISFYHQQTQSGVYDLQAGSTLRRMQDQTLGIVGLGNIGQHLAKLAAGVGLNVIAYSRTPKQIDHVQMVSFDDFLSTSDYVSIHAPLTSETEGMFGESEFTAMKSSAFLINTARGGLIDHDALSKAIADGQICGAALDVQVPEPPDLSKLPYSDSRVIVTPHAAFVSQESLTDLRRRSAQQVVDRLSGLTPKHIVNEAEVS